MDHVSLSKLRDIGVIENNGGVSGFPELNDKQAQSVIYKILSVVNKTKGSVETNIKDYLQTCTGRSMYVTFPDVIVRQVLNRYEKLILDHLLLEDDEL